MDPTGVRLRTSFGYRGCEVTLLKAGGSATLLRAEFRLRSVAYLRVRTEPAGSQWTGTNLIFQSSAGSKSIWVARPFEAGLAGERSTSVGQTTLSWQIGYVRGGAENPHVELGQRLVKALSHAVALCGGTIRSEPF